MIGSDGGDSMVRRGQLEIMGDLLEVVSVKDKPTNIMYSTNLSWQTLQNYLERAEALNLVKVVRRGNSRRIVLTGEGQKALMEYRYVKRALIGRKLY